MVALRIAASDLGVRRIGSDKRAFDEALGMALKCAAMAAKHPNPDRLLCDWLAISTRLHDNVGLIAEVRGRSPPSSLDKVAAKLVDGSPVPVNPPCLWLSFSVAGSRPLSRPYLHSSALKGTLQDAVPSPGYRPASCAPVSTAVCSLQATATARSTPSPTSSSTPSGMMQPSHLRQNSRWMSSAQ
ncbi:hypothetical protein ZWY2020_059656 [Hordeum vulgare]|nr:hypothetical protein ZWY2020_059656 [Hordeum vulgare]